MVSPLRTQPKIKKHNKPPKIMFRLPRSYHRNKLSRRGNKMDNPLTIVGLDTKGLNPIKIQQLCVGPNCLIYKFIQVNSSNPH